MQIVSTLMTQQLQKQLNQLEIPYTEDNGIVHVNKQNPSDVLKFEKNHFYLIYLDQGDMARKMMEITSMNWNQGRVITSAYLKCEYIQSMGNMTQLNASGFDPATGMDLGDIYLNIWVNSNIIKIISEIK